MVAVAWRACDVRGDPLQSQASPAPTGHGSGRVSGLAERPSDVGLSTRRVLVTVNGRAVRDTGVIRAAEAAAAQASRAVRVTAASTPSCR